MSVTRSRGAGLSASAGDPRASVSGDDWKQRLVEALGRLGTNIVVDRCYVYENLRGPDGQLWMDLLAEWRSDDVASVLNDLERQHAFYPSFQRWIDVLGAGEEIFGPVSHLPDPERLALQAEGTVSTWQAPVLPTGGG